MRRGKQTKKASLISEYNKLGNQLGEAKSSGHKCYINIKEQTKINHFQEGKKKKRPNTWRNS